MLVKDTLMIKALTLLLFVLTLIACSQQDNGSPAPGGGPQLSITNLHQVEPRGSVDRTTPIGLWESEERVDEDSETTIVDRIQISEDLVNFSRKCTFEDGSSLVVETIALSVIEEDVLVDLVLLEDIVAIESLGTNDCAINIQADDFEFKVDVDSNIWTLFDLPFKKLADR